jgi:hypothetical protein
MVEVPVELRPGSCGYREHRDHGQQQKPAMP